MTVNDIRVQYGEVLSGEQVRQILHISKRKCTWILEHGYIPCSDSGGKTRRFAVRAEDLASYMDDSAKHPERYTTPYAELSLRKIPQAEGKAKTVTDKPVYPTFPRELPEDFRLWLEDEWCGADDLLTNDDAAELTGYAVTTVDNHIRAGRMKAVHTQDGLRIPKAWLVEFMCGHGCMSAGPLERRICRWLYLFAIHDKIYLL